MQHPSNDELINDPQACLQGLAEGIGHYLRIAAAGYVSTNPQFAQRMSALLADPGEALALVAELRNGALTLDVRVIARDVEVPRSIYQKRTPLPPIQLRH